MWVKSFPRPSVVGWCPVPQSHHIPPSRVKRQCGVRSTSMDPPGIAAAGRVSARHIRRGRLALAASPADGGSRGGARRSGKRVHHMQELAVGSLPGGGGRASSASMVELQREGVRRRGERGTKGGSLPGRGERRVVQGARGGGAERKVLAGGHPARSRE